MSDTHPNAYLQEAQDKRAEAAKAIATAEQYEAKAYELDPSLRPDAVKPEDVPAQAEPAQEPSPSMQSSLPPEQVDNSRKK